MSELKFKRSEFTIAVNKSYMNADSDTGARKGYVCGPFGIHGNKYGWTVTQLCSGLKAAEPKNMRDARERVAAFLSLPVDWTLARPLDNVGDDVLLAVRKIARGED